jgi:predicted metal-dependent peptidase
MDTRPEKSPIAGDNSHEQWPKLKLSTVHEQMWMETRAAVLWSQPSFSDIWYAMMVDRDGLQAWFTDKIPVAATDDKFMYLNPVVFFVYLLDERIFISVHEILHCMFNHCGLFYRLQKDGHIRYTDGIVLPFVIDIMQIAADCVINDILVRADVGKMPANAWHLPNIIKGDMSVLDAYRILYKMSKKNGGGGRQLPVKGKSFDVHLPPGGGSGKTPAQAESERNPQQWINAINSAMESAKLAGKLPANLERLFCSTMEVTVDWRELLQLCVSKGLGRDSHSWMFLDGELALRGIGFPGRVKWGCDLLSVFLDTSGSINQKTMDYFTSNLANIVENVRPKRIIVCQCDAKVHTWDDINDIADLNGKVRGGGGTSFCPPFERLDKEGEQPDMTIYFTDLEGSFPKQPDHPVIWACINDKKGPWGMTVKVPVQSTEEI